MSSLTPGTPFTTCCRHSSITLIHGSPSVGSIHIHICYRILNICLAALEVYVRRAYRAYALLSIDYEEVDDDAPSAVTWRFNLGQSRSPPATPALTRMYVVRFNEQYSDTYLSS